MSDEEFNAYEHGHKDGIIQGLITAINLIDTIDSNVLAKMSVYEGSDFIIKELQHHITQYQEKK